MKQQQQQHNDGARVQDALLQLSLPYTHTLPLSLSLSLARFLPELICIILIWHFWPRRQAPVAVISKHSHGDTFRLHAICINCSVPTLSLSHTLYLSHSFAAVVVACQPKLLPFDFGNYNAFLCNNLSFVLSLFLSVSLCLSRSLLDLLCRSFFALSLSVSLENFNFSFSCCCDIGSQFQVNYLLGLGAIANWQLPAVCNDL